MLQKSTNCELGGMAQIVILILENCAIRESNLVAALLFNYFTHTMHES